MKTHYSYQYENHYGGYNTSTLCSRAAGDGDLNSSDIVSDVDCKMCKQILGNPNHYRWKRVPYPN